MTNTVIDTLDELKRISYTLENVEKSSINNKIKLSNLENNLTEYQNKMNLVIESRQYYKKAIDIIYEKSVQELTDVLNSALRYIFKDRNLEVDVVLSDKRGKSLSFVIKDDGNLVSLKRGMGMGVKCVISAILHIYFLQCKNSKILLLDEAYSNISKEYVADFFDFLYKLCEKLEFKIVLITHDERFVDYANKVYRIDQGKVIEL